MKRNTVISSDPLRKNENKILLNTLSDTLHRAKERSRTKTKKISIERVKWEINKTATHTKTKLHNKRLRSYLTL